ncbi:MAG TPA: class II fructose-bisphosphate aldolase [Pseudonocardiaceae bacterium]|nr:class II fructose-bisphosphate aldolase [Pseudonocardiaceae bacterium]
MTLVPTNQLVADAMRRNGVVAAVNVITLEHAEAICAAATSLDVPVILQISENAVRFHHRQLRPIAAATAEVARLAGVEIALHLDHVTDDDLVTRAADNGFSSVMYDAGALPFAENVERTARAVRAAHERGLWVEAELGYVGGKPGAAASAHAAGVRTDPDEAADYVARTSVDALAVAVGSEHAMTTRSAMLDIDLILRLRDRLDVPLVLHGSSGVPESQLRKAAEAGIVKINVGTALNVAMTHAVRDVLAHDERIVDPRQYLAAARQAMADTVGRLLSMLP